MSKQRVIHRGGLLFADSLQADCSEATPAFASLCQPLENIERPVSQLRWRPLLSVDLPSRLRAVSALIAFSSKRPAGRRGAEGEAQSPLLRDQIRLYSPGSPSTMRA